MSFGPNFDHDPSAWQVDVSVTDGLSSHVNVTLAPTELSEV